VHAEWFFPPLAEHLDRRDVSTLSRGNGRSTRMECGQEVERKSLIVKSILFHAPLKPSGSLMLAELDDGRLCIVKNDKPLPEFCWPKTEMHKAVAKFKEMKRELLRKA
jgi:hypothetical protein